MELATPSAFSKNPTLVWEWYAWRQDLISQCEPNPAHLTLAKWEKRGLFSCLITQNVDGLHRRAGSSKILEVHGNIWAVKCLQCNHRGRLGGPAEGIPLCPECEASLRPDVVWFGETLDSEKWEQAIKWTLEANVLLVIGTSGVVHPVASLPYYAKQKGAIIIEFNIEETPISSICDFSLIYL